MASPSPLGKHRLRAGGQCRRAPRWPPRVLPSCAHPAGDPPLWATSSPCQGERPNRAEEEGDGRCSAAGNSREAA